MGLNLNLRVTNTFSIKRCVVCMLAIPFYTSHPYFIFFESNKIIPTPIEQQLQQWPS